jgi:hypothetical protein
METSQKQPTTLGERLAAKNPAFTLKMRQMALPLAPLVQLNTGTIHKSFPANLLSFWLLTEKQLDELASFYHQRTPSHFSSQYPCPITNWHQSLTMEDKRRKIGRFIGLRGCETPPAFVGFKTDEQLVEEARRARLAEEELRKKYRWY